MKFSPNLISILKNNFLTDILFLEYPNDSGYYGSGDGDPECFDDEDCDVTEGSGSGGKIRNDLDDDEDSEGSGYDEDEDDEEVFEPRWPPFLTSTTVRPHQDIVLTEDDRTTMRPPVVIMSGGTGAVAGASRVSSILLASLGLLLLLCHNTL